jgi:hypothetical protein
MLSDLEYVKYCTYDEFINETCVDLSTILSKLTHEFNDRIGRSQILIKN